MENIISKIRDVLGIPNFYHLMPNGSGTQQTYQWDYGAMLEYLIAGVLFALVIGSVFKFLRTLVK